MDRVSPADTSSSDHPFWSVLIPTYRPQEEFLRQTLDAVLQQDRGRAHMQITVVDDGTPDTDVGSLVLRLAGPRVQFHRTGRNLGLAGCWNACVGQARGAWVHLLHQDDLVFAGFYDALEQLIQRFPSAGTAFTRHATIDGDGTRQYLSPAESDNAGILPGWQLRLSSWQRLRCPAVVVRRDVYAQCGEFRADLPFCLDWEMWARIAAVHPFAYSPEILAAHREHKRSETSRLGQTAAPVHDFLKTFALLRARLPAEHHAAADAEFAAQWESYAAPILPHLYAQRAYNELRAILTDADGLPVSPAFQRQLREWAWKMNLKTIPTRLQSIFAGHRG
jgi:glycosyltransferase involved in cell wall biosynthesis